MSIDKEKIKEYGDTLFDCLRNRATIDPLTDQEAGITIEDAYQISLHILQRRLDDGEKIIENPDTPAGQKVADEYKQRPKKMGKVDRRFGKNDA